jgi:putative mRNA 3-end processing factor
MPSSSSPLLRIDDRGLFCEAGGFHIDPWKPVERAVISHGHGDHARPGSGRYLAAAPSLPILEKRLGSGARIETAPFGETVRVRDVAVSFHPAGHILGSAQVRVERGGEVWVFSGDYKRAADPSCEPFEPVRCHTFITEATFGLPIYVWDDTGAVAREILAWWEGNRALDRPSVLFCYALGKAQRILAELARLTDRPVWVHGAIETLTRCYRQAGIALLPTRRVGETVKGQPFVGELVLAPPASGSSLWMRRFGRAATAFASGWMRVRGTRRRRGVDRGFVISDHADWPDLLRTIADTGASRVLTTHGYSETLARYLRQQGLEAGTLATPFEGEEKGETGGET